MRYSVGNTLQFSQYAKVYKPKRIQYAKAQIIRYSSVYMLLKRILHSKSLIYMVKHSNVSTILLALMCSLCIKRGLCDEVKSLS